MAVRIDCHTFPGDAQRPGVREVRRNERRDSVLGGSTYPDSGPPVRMAYLVRFRVDRVQRVVCRDEQIADAAELIVRADVVAVLVEDLDSMVAAVRDEQTTAGVECHCVRCAELAAARAKSAPLLDELAVLRELHDA